MEWHPFSKIFPMLGEDELQALADDIKANGLKEPIITDGDAEVIIDGRNRQAACAIAGVKPIYAPFSGTDAEILALVISKNLHRRHLDASQRAMVAANIANIPKHVHKPKSREGQICPSTESGVTTEDAAKLMNVSPRSVKSARKVKDKGIPELAEAVQAGEIAVSKAAEIASLPAEKQRAILAGEDVAVPETAASTPKSRRIEPGTSALPTPSEEAIGADKDSDALFAAKRYWRKLSKKDRKVFMKWAGVDNGKPETQSTKAGMAAVDELVSGVGELDAAIDELLKIVSGSMLTMSILVLRNSARRIEQAAKVYRNVDVIVGMLQNQQFTKVRQRLGVAECTAHMRGLFGWLARDDQRAILAELGEELNEPKSPKLIGSPPASGAKIEVYETVTEVT